jgi:hypothetical protein
MFLVNLTAKTLYIRVPTFRCRHHGTSKGQAEGFVADRNVYRYDGKKGEAHSDDQACNRGVGIYRGHHSHESVQQGAQHEL